jgi:hypothetical protein
MSRDMRSLKLRPLRDLILVGNLMAMKLGQDPNNLGNTWDEMVERVRASGLLDQLTVAAISPGLPAWVETREAEAIQRNDMACWRALSERLALECLSLESAGVAVPLSLRLKADDAWQKYQDMHPAKEPA